MLYNFRTHNISGATPNGIVGSIVLQKLMTSLNIPADAMAKMILLEKSLYDSGTSPQDITHILQLISDHQKVNLVTLEPIMAKSLSNSEAESKGVLAICDLIDAFRGAKVAPELTSKIILLQKAIESGIVSPESTVQELSDKLRENGVNPADFLEAFKDVLKKNDVTTVDLGKAALIQKAATAIGLDTNAFSALIDIQNALLEAGLNEQDVLKILNELVKSADIEGLGKNMLNALEGHARLKDDELAMGNKIADAIDRSASKSTKFSKLLHGKQQELKSMSLPDMVSFLSQILQENAGPSADALAKAMAVQAVLANSSCDPAKLAHALRIANGMVKNGVTKSNVSRMIHEALEDKPEARKKAVEEIKKPLKDLPSIMKDSSFISFLQKYQSAMTEACSSVDNLKEIFENAMAVVGLTREDVARAAMVQKTLSASGVTPAVLAQAVLFQRALAASGLSPEEILGVLSKVRHHLSF